MKLFSLDHATRLCRTEISSSFFRQRPIGASWRSLRAFAALGCLSLAIATAPLHAGGGPTGKDKCKEKYKDKCPVEVQGIVEVLNDVLNQPYAVTVTNAGAFDIPDGKRLVIETISYWTVQGLGKTGRLSLDGFRGAASGVRVVFLPVQDTFVRNQEMYQTSVIPVKMRVDSVEGVTEEIRIIGDSAFVTFEVTVFGYLVDL